MSYVDELARKHKEMGVVRHHVTLGPDGVGQPEAVAREVLSSIWQMERGHAASHDRFDAPIWHLPTHYRNTKAVVCRMRDRVLGVRNPYK